MEGHERLNCLEIIEKLRRQPIDDEVVFFFSEDEQFTQICVNLSPACRENSPYVGQTALKLLAELIQKTRDKEKLAKTLLPILFDDGLTNSKASVQKESISLVKILTKSIVNIYITRIHEVKQQPSV